MTTLLTSVTIEITTFFNHESATYCFSTVLLCI